MRDPNGNLARQSGTFGRRRELFSIAVIVIVALAWHAVSLPWQSLFVDEIAELRHARLDAAEVWNNPDSMPPLFTYLLQGWLAIAGSDEMARWLPAFCGVASILVVWLFGRELIDARTGVAAASLWAINPLQLYYSQLVRGYAQLALLVAIAMWMYFRAIRTNAWRDWAGFALASACGVFTHYYFAIFLALAALVLVVEHRGLPSRRAVMAFVAAGVLSAPVLSCFTQDFKFQHDLREPRRLDAAAIGYTYFSLLSGYSLSPSGAELHAITACEAALRSLPWIVALGVTCLPLVVAGAIALAERRRLLTMIAFVLGPVVIVGAAGWATGITYNVRHIAWCGVPLTVFLGAGVAQSAGWRWLPPAVVGLVGVMLFATYQRNWTPAYQNEDVRGAAAFLEKQAADAPVFFASDYIARAFNYYAPNAARYIELPEPGEVSRVVTDEGVARVGIEQVRNRIAEGESAWLVYSREFHGDPHGLLLSGLKREFSLEPVATFAGIRVFRLNR